ncbi:MAG: hypothetical protein CMH49_06715 [Myxococcales bacterium]|nr:hypothetical protein [Myxococcales bacterium]
MFCISHSILSFLLITYKLVGWSLLMFKKTIKNLNLLDSHVLVFLIYFNSRLLYAPTSSDTSFAQTVFLTALVFLTIVLVLSRGEVLSHPRARGIVHRLGLLMSVLGLYLLAMREALAALQPTLMDQQLIKLDQLLFTAVPASYFDQYSSPAITEWFAFFYYSYFLLIVFTILPSAFFGRSTLARGLVLGPVMLVCIGHILYTIVPGRGPYVAMTFQNELTGGFFWQQVNDMVSQQGALLDIFPSLHTAIPTFLVSYLYVNRSQWPLRISWYIVWPVLLFFTLNIIIATMYLRWHYAVDVIAGLSLAFSVTWIVSRHNPTDAQRQVRGQQAILEPCFGPGE